MKKFLNKVLAKLVTTEKMQELVSLKTAELSYEIRILRALVEAQEQLVRSQFTQIKRHEEINNVLIKERQKVKAYEHELECKLAFVKLMHGI